MYIDYIHTQILPFNPFRAPEPLPILNPSNFVPKNGFPVVKGLTSIFFVSNQETPALLLKIINNGWKRDPHNCPPDASTSASAR